MMIGKPTTYPYHTKKLMKEYGPEVPSAMKKLYKTICDKITSSGFNSSNNIMAIT